MKQSFTYQLRILAETLGIFFLMIGIMSAFALKVHSNPVSFLSGMLVAFFSVIPVTVSMSVYSIYYNTALSFGATRKHFFAAWQVTKLLQSISLTVLAVATFLLLPIFGSDVRTTITQGTPLLCGMIWMTSTLGEAMGVVVLRYGKLAMKIIGVCFGLLCGGVGGFVGYNAVGGDFVPADLFAVVLRPSVLFFILLAASLVLACVNWLMLRRTMVR